MKHLKWIVGGLLLAIVPVFALVSVAQAQRFATNVDKDQKVYSSLYSSGKSVAIRGEIFGDVFCAGKTVVVDAIVHGDVVCAGQDVTVSGVVEGDVRVAGQAVTVDATIGHSATVAGMKFSLDADAKVGQDITAVGSELNVKGEIARDATVSGASIVVNGPIGRNLTAKSDGITLKDGAAIGGNFNQTGSVKPALAKGAEVHGQLVQTKPKKQRSGGIFNPVFYLFVIISLLIISLVLASLFPAYLRRAGDTIIDNPVTTLVVGGAASLLVPAIGVAAALAIVGIPLTLFLLLALALAAMLSGPVVAYVVGRLILRQSKSIVGIVALGGLVLVTTYFIPIIGFVCMLAAYWFGLGAILLDVRARSSLAPATNQ